MGFDLAQAISDAAPDALLRVPAGEYVTCLTIEKPITLLAMGAVTLDGRHQGAVLRVLVPGAWVRLTGFTIVGGNAEDAGGGVSLLEGSLELRDCALRFNKAPLYGGGGLYVRGARADIHSCRIEGNTGRQGGGVLVDGEAELVMRDSLLVQNAAIEGGAVRDKEGARAQLLGCTIADNRVVGARGNGSALHVSASTTRRPTLAVSHCIISERTPGVSVIFNSPKLPGTVTVSDSLLPEGVTVPGEHNRTGAPKFLGTGPEPYQLTASSPAVGAAAADGYEAGARDLLGRPRITASGTSDLGAYARP